MQKNLMNKNRKEKSMSSRTTPMNLNQKWGKLIGASVTSAYKNAHLSKGMVCRWEIGQIEWQEIRKKRLWISVNSWEVIRGSEPHWIEEPGINNIISSKGGDSS